MSLQPLVDNRSDRVYVTELRSLSQSSLRYAIRRLIYL